MRILKLVREINEGSRAGGRRSGPRRAEDEPCERDARREYTPPTVRVKSMVATRRGAQRFGRSLAAAALARGFFAGAMRKAFVADGAEANWTIQRQWFSDFVAILDFIHALSYVFAAAMAGSGVSRRDGRRMSVDSRVWRGKSRR